MGSIFSHAFGPGLFIAIAKVPCTCSVRYVPRCLSLAEHFVSENLDGLVPKLTGSQVAGPLLDLDDAFAFQAIDHVVDGASRKSETFGKVFF